MNAGTIAVDVSALAWWAHYGYMGRTGPSGQANGHVYGAVSKLLDMRAMLPRHTFVFCYDGSGAVAARREILPKYKSNRPERWKPTPDVEALLGLMRGLHLRQEDREADDGVTFAVNTTVGAGRDAVVLSGDSDLWYLTDRARVWSLNLKRWVEPADIEKKFGVRDACSITLQKAICGDSTDTVPAAGARLPKVALAAFLGATRARTPREMLARRCVSPEGSWPALSPHEGKRLDAAWDAVLRNFQVVSPWPMHPDQNTLRRVDGDLGALEEAFDRWGLTHDFGGRIGAFVRPPDLTISPN